MKPPVRSSGLNRFRFLPAGNAYPKGRQVKKPSALVRQRSRSTLLCVIVSAVVIGLESCSSVNAGPTVPTTPQAPQALATATSSSAPRKEDCSGTTDRIGKAVLGFPQISKIMMIAACGEASIQTSLPAGVLGSASATTGVEICHAAATVAYQGKVTSVTVVATDGSELAIGLKGADCIP
jgi:hypothetical protein